ncbi:MAG: hypothetical protein JSW68_10685, partial [Burkholderiales bacterium]
MAAGSIQIERERWTAPARLRRPRDWSRLALGLLFAALVPLAVSGCQSLGQAPDEQAASPTPEPSDAERRARIRLDLAASYFQQRNFVVAIEEVNQALALDPRLAAAHG